MSLLELDGIQKRFGSVEALRGVTLSVEAGSVVGLVGDNGAGKSTLMKTITGIYEPDGGAIRFDGKDVTLDTPGHIRSIGIEMIYQDLALAPQQDVASNIFLGREPTKSLLGFIPGLIDRPKIVAEAEKMLQRLGARIPSVLSPVGVLSGGQQQSVAIARALTFGPKLVIMDEPTAALAVREVDHVLDLIRELKRQSIAVILISHRLTDVFAVSDRIVALRQGQIIADEQTAETSMNQVVSHIVGS
ncbi:MAG: ATP-binding cassette domain-containing protein [Pseudomonadota bacterium]